MNHLAVVARVVRIVSVLDHTQSIMTTAIGYVSQYECMWWSAAQLLTFVSLTSL